MTVTPELPDLLTDTEPVLTGEARLEEIYRTYWRPLCNFIFFRLDDRHRSLAEDLAADAFLALWTKYLSTGAKVWGPWSLLCAIARTAIIDFYKVRANKRLDFAVDFTDPANRGIERGHSYASDQPESAQLAQELDEAMEAMADLSQQWRDQHSQTHIFRTMLIESSSKAPMRPSVRKDTQAKFEAAQTDEANLLERFRQACSRVGELRIELEEAGGPNWCSSTGQPPTQSRSYLKPGTMSDPDRTHCGAGHLMTLDNTTFNKATRICRACRAADMKKNRQQSGAPSTKAKPTVSDEAIARARELLKDPSLSLRKVAALVGVARTTLTDNITDIEALRDPNALRNRTPDEVIDQARALLLDPAHKRTLAAVAAEIGVTPVTLYARIPNLSQLRRELYDAPKQLVSA